jgi:hypothetical protein
MVIYFTYRESNTWIVVTQEGSFVLESCNTIATDGPLITNTMEYYTMLCKEYVVREIQSQASEFLSISR